jgi:hypothetical protein
MNEGRSAEDIIGLQRAYAAQQASNSAERRLAGAQQNAAEQAAINAQNAIGAQLSLGPRYRSATIREVENGYIITSSGASERIARTPIDISACIREIFPSRDTEQRNEAPEETDPEVEYPPTEQATVVPSTASVQRERSFSDDLKDLINHHSRENYSNTPDLVLAQFLVGTIKSFEEAVNQREAWYGRAGSTTQGCDASVEQASPVEQSILGGQDNTVYDWDAVERRKYVLELATRWAAVDRSINPLVLAEDFEKYVRSGVPAVPAADAKDKEA